MAGAGGAIVSWADLRSGICDIYAQRIDANGNLLWGTGGVAIATVANTQQNPRMDDDSAGGAVIAWRDYRNGASNPQAFVQRVNGNGVVMTTNFTALPVGQGVMKQITGTIPPPTENVLLKC